MKFLIYGLNFSPELVGIGKYTGELAEALVERGHQVSVITSPPYYPGWKVWQGYRWHQYKAEAKPGLRVMRCPLWVPKKVTGLRRVMHLCSFAVSSAPVVLWEAGKKPDLIFCVAPAIASAPAAAITGRVLGVSTWLHVQDFELEAAIRLGMVSLNHGLLMGLTRAIERAIFSSFDRLSSISRPMVEHLSAKGVAIEKTTYFPNWVDTQIIHPISGMNPFRQELGVDDSSVIALYSGSMGAKQGLEVMVQAAARLKDNTQVHFILCGEGPAKEGLQAAARGMANVHFLPLQPAERLNELLNMADIHLLPQRADAADLMMPSKILGMLASGKPVVAGCHPNTSLYEVACQAGMAVEPENSQALADAISSLAENAGKRKELGGKGRQYAEEHFSKEKVIDQFIQEAAEFISARSSNRS